jgi:hypothetical protein
MESLKQGGLQKRGLFRDGAVTNLLARTPARPPSNLCWSSMGADVPDFWFKIISLISNYKNMPRK